MRDYCEPSTELADYRNCVSWVLCAFYRRGNKHEEVKPLVPIHTINK